MRRADIEHLFAMARPPQFQYDDIESLAVSKVKAAIKELSPESRAFVLAWIVKFYGDNGMMFSPTIVQRRKRVTIDDQAIAAAVSNVEWAVSRIIARDFPMRPEGDKCGKCDFQKLCTRRPEDFENAVDPPPALHIPNGEQAMIAAYSEFEPA